MVYICYYNMEHLKKTIAKLESDVTELRQFQTKIQGSTQSKNDIHYCTSSQEFGEYDLDQIDTFRFNVSCWVGVDRIPLYNYVLLNPTPELTAYLNTQGKTFVSPANIPVDPEKFEKYCMEQSGTTFVLTSEIRKCLDSKLWEFAASPTAGFSKDAPAIRSKFYTDITISFDNTYTLSPHVSFYITPITQTPAPGCCIHEITTKQVVFRINYDPISKANITGLKLHYSISGIVKLNDENLLD
jgi:hypothetical protein